MSSNSENGGSPETRLDDWLDQLEEARELGQPLAPEELCDDPDLLTELRERYEKLCRMDGVFGARDEDHSEARTFVPSPEQARSRVIGRYKLLQRIGEGGMGSVWMAEQQEPIRRKVALKVIRSGHAGRQVIARFEAERQALAMMDHQHIARVFDAGTTESGVPYFVMELVEGIPITEYCNRRRLNVPERLQLFMQVCQAIQHAHTKGIIHRDIKPSNVLVTQYDGKPVVKVIDFGIAKALQADLTDKTCFTEFGQVLGTLAYMSPEQAEMNALSIDTRTDVFALGILLYDLLTGNTPISRETIEQSAGFEILNLIRSLETPRASELLLSSGPRSTTIAQERRLDLRGLLSLLRGDLDAVLMKATANERDRRYTTPEAFARDIERYLSNQPIEARPPSVAYRFRKFVQRNRAASVALGLLILGSVGTSAGMMWALAEKDRAQHQEGLANQATQRERIARGEADTSAAEAVAARLETEAALHESQARLARSNYFLAHARWSDDRITEAIDILERVPPEHRHIEWKLTRQLFEGTDRTFQGREGPVSCVAIHPDGETLATAYGDGTIGVLNLRSGSNILQFETDSPIVRMAFIDGGQSLVLLDRGEGPVGYGGDVLFIPLSEGASPRSPLPELRFTCFDVSVDESMLVTGDGDGRIVIRDLESLQQKLMHQVTTEHGTWDNDVTDVTFSPDSKSVTFAVSNGSVSQWNLANGEVATLLKSDTKTNSVAYSPDGKYLAWGRSSSSFTEPSEICVWHVAREELLRTVLVDAAGLSNVTFTPCGDSIIAATNGLPNEPGIIREWDLRTGELRRVFKGHRGAVRTLTCTTDAAHIVSGSADGTVKTWDRRVGMPFHSLVGQSDEIADACWAPDASLLLTVHADQTAHAWHPPGFEEFSVELQHEGAIKCVSISPDSSRIAFYAEREDAGVLTIWDRSSRRVMQRILIGNERVTSLSFSPDGRWIASQADSGTVTVREIDSGEVQSEIDSLKSDVQFSPDSQYLLSSGGSIWWDAATGDPFLSNVWDSHHFHPVVFTADGELCAVHTGSTIEFRDVDSREVVDEITRDARPLCFSQDGRRLVGVPHHDNELLWVWDTVSGEELLQLQLPARTQWVAAACRDSGCHLAVLGLDGRLHIAADLRFDDEGGAVTINGLRTDRSEILWHRHESEEDFTVSEPNDWYAMTFHAAWTILLAQDISPDKGGRADDSVPSDDVVQLQHCFSNWTREFRSRNPESETDPAAFFGSGVRGVIGRHRLPGDRSPAVGF